jgi:sulfotransferase
MSKTVNFISGLPRSCSTLLCNVLAQNPKFHSTASSGLVDLIYPARKNLSDLGEFKAMDPKDAENMFLDWARGGILNAFNSLTDRPVVFDKGRSWIGYLDLLFQLFPNVKVIVPVRDVRGILTSMEKIHRKHPAYFEAEEHPATNFTTTEKRIKSWLTSPKAGIAIERLYEASNRFKDKLHFVHAEQLAEQPKQTLMKLYTYLGEEYYTDHDFNNVEQYTKEHDGVWWPHGDHGIRQQIKPLKKEWNDVLGKELSDMVNQKFSWINNL